MPGGLSDAQLMAAAMFCSPQMLGQLRQTIDEIVDRVVAPWLCRPFWWGLQVALRACEEAWSHPGCLWWVFGVYVPVDSSTPTGALIALPDYSWRVRGERVRLLPGTTLQHLVAWYGPDRVDAVPTGSGPPMPECCLVSLCIPILDGGIDTTRAMQIETLDGSYVEVSADASLKDAVALATQRRYDA